MLTSQAIITVIVYLLYIGLKFTSPLLSRVLLFILFLWAIPNFGLSNSAQWVFYVLAFLVGLYLTDHTGLQTESNRADLNGAAKGGILSGPVLKIFSIGLGIALIFIIRATTNARGQFLGVASLSVAGPQTIIQKATILFAPAMSGALGIIENLLIFSIMMALITEGHLVVEGITYLLSIIIQIPFIGVIFIPFQVLLQVFAGALMPVTPFLLAALIFGLFHFAVYGIMWSMIIWAAMIMVLWIISFFITGRDTTAADTAHFGHNALVTMQQSTQLAFTGPVPIIGG